MVISTSSRKILCAIDTTDMDAALGLAECLRDQVGGVKLGKEFFTAQGPAGVARIAYTGHRIFLDLKFHDIPTTVYRAVKTINLIKPNYLSIHSLGGNDMISAAVKASRGVKILSVSLLSHHEQKSINEIGIKNSLKNEIKKLINNALKNNVHGLILAPKDLEILKQIKKRKKIEIFVPGIRPKKIKKNEHKRSLGHLDAIKRGANYIIVGRPITKSKNPKKMLKLINEEIKQYLKKE